MAKRLTVPGFALQEQPTIYITALPGQWLLKHSTPSWRIKDREKGFQRIVKEERARQIAVAVLDAGRTFPNAIILATNIRSFGVANGRLTLPSKIKFLVVDGQHRLWAQKFATQEATYGCFIHTGLTEVDMARLFLEINDNQKRVPSSLRWDLVRLVRPSDDPYAIMAAELVYELTTDKASPLYQRVDLTGEQSELTLKQGSLAPEIRNIVSTGKAGLRNLDFDAHYEILRRYLTAIRSVDPDGWRSAQSPFYGTRVLRVLLRVLPEMVTSIGQAAGEIPVTTFREYLERIRAQDLAQDRIRAIQGSAGMKEIYDLIKEQMRI